MNKFGILDIGSNSVKISVFTSLQKKIEVCGEFNEVTKLAENAEVSGFLQSDAVFRTILAVEILYKKVIDFFPKIMIFPFATAAVRDAKNRDEFTKKFFMKFNQKLHILSELDEAKFVRFGAESEFSNGKKIISVDLGGGSTEISIGQAGAENFIFAKSFPLGCVRLNNRFAMNEKISDEFLQSAESFLHKIFTLPQIENFNDFVMIFTGGTAMIFAKLVGKRNEITFRDVNLWIKKLSQMSLVEKEEIKIIKSRASTFMAGILIIKSLLKLTRKESFMVSERGLRYGLALDLIKNNEVKI